MRQISRATGIALFMSFARATKMTAQERESPPADHRLKASPKTRNGNG